MGCFLFSRVYVCFGQRVWLYLEKGSRGLRFTLFFVQLTSGFPTLIRFVFQVSIPEDKTNTKPRSPERGQ